MPLVRTLIADKFMLLMIATVALASVFPAHGSAVGVVDILTNIAIMAMFFLYGVKLSPQAVMGGLTDWKLHLTVFASTYVLFPVLGLVFVLVPDTILPANLKLGFLFLSALPSTIQSSIAFTSIARGNVPAAVCSASASNIIGTVLTPVLAGFLLSRDGGGPSFGAIRTIMETLLLPFVLGQILRPWLVGFVTRHKKLIGFTDRGSILFVVYGAFSKSVVDGLWSQMPLTGLAGLVVMNAIMLALVLVITRYAARALGFNRADEITIVFCGSKKSLSSGVPIAGAMFAGPDLGAILLPVMLFHQMQLMVCAVLAQRYARTAPEERPAVATAPAPAGA